MTADTTARRRMSVGAGALALVAMGALSACGGSSTESPSTTPSSTTTTTTTAPSVSPTEKGLEPGGGNKFTPTVKAPTPATAVPGDN